MAADEQLDVTYADGRTERLRLHEYERLYAVPGLYEEVVQNQLGCRTPTVVAGLLSEAAGGRPLRVLDAGAGSGVSGAALAAAGLEPVVGVDILPAARAAALRDRPGLYGAYLAADLCALTPGEEAVIREAEPEALACVGAVGSDDHLPAAAVSAALALLSGEPLVAYAHDVEHSDPIGHVLGAGRELARERYVHRRTATGGERIWEAIVLRMPAQAAVPRSS